MANGENPQYQLELRMTLLRLDDRGYPTHHDRFEMADNQKLGPMSFPKLLEIMANIHNAVTNIGAIVTEQCETDLGQNG